MKLPLTGYPEKLRPSAAQISELLVMSKRTICSCTSRTSDVEKLDAGSVNTASWTVAGGGDVGVEGIVGADPELPHAATPPATIKSTTVRTI
jgi:hypothetical protein